MARKNIRTRTRKKQADEFIKNNQWAQAAVLYKEICRIDPMDFEAWFRLGIIYGESNEASESEKYTRKALALKPNNLTAIANLGGALIAQFRHEEALVFFRQAHEMNPRATHPIGCMANIYVKIGQKEKAYELIKPLISASIYDINVALCYAKLCSHFGDTTEAEAYIKLVLHSESTPVKDKRRILFSLGFLHDKRGAYDEAFSYFYKANQSISIVYAAKQHEQDIEAIIDRFTRESMSGMPHASNDTQRPVFIVGMPRSGTSLVEQILASHSQIAGAGELQDMALVTSSLSSPPNPNKTLHIYELDLLSPENLDQAAQRYLNKLDSVSSEALRVIDKLPDNYQRLGLIQLLFPGARIIHCQRDPLDTCLSCYFQFFTGYHPYAYDLKSLGHYYLQYLRLMTHWRNELDLNMYEVRYEDLVQNQEKISHELVEFLDLTWENNCLDFHKSKRLVNTASYEQVRRPMYKKSMARWRNYEKHLEPLIRTLGDLDQPAEYTCQIKK